MSKWIAGLAVAAMSFSVAVAEEVKSGLGTGEKIPAFIVQKIGGAADDGVEVGKELCYRCKYGARPQVMVFTRTTGGEIASLTKELDAAIAKNSELQLSAFVNVMNADKTAAETAAKSLLPGAGKVPVVVPVENENGPANYGINPDAEVTVIIANKMQVFASHGYAAGKFDAAAVQTVLKDVEGALK